VNTSAAPDFAILEAAATWHVDLSISPQDGHLREAHSHWLASDPRHRLAWERLARLHGKLQQVNPTLARPILAGAQSKRREVLKVLSMLLAAGGAGTLAWQHTPLPDLLADQRTAVGERQTVRLADGSQLQLDTDTAVDIHYSANLRELHLLHGAILIQTANDPQSRPFLVHTPEGSIRALGTRFTVRSDAGSSQVCVQEHAVEVRTALALEPVTCVTAGQQLRFTAQSMHAPEPAPEQADAWSRGILLARNQRLDAFVRELQRYRAGYLHCAPEVAGLRLSGAFYLADTDRILANLTTTLPLRVQRFTRYWVRLLPA
jgi:transmembrane sensor